MDTQTIRHGSGGMDRALGHGSCSAPAIMDPVHSIRDLDAWILRNKYSVEAPQTWILSIEMPRRFLVVAALTS